MKLGSGWSDRPAVCPGACPTGRCGRAGVRVALGTDGAASNNNLDMFETMKLAALLQKHSTGDPAALTAHEAFAMATAGGRRGAAHRRRACCEQAAGPTWC